jgi:uncharacterized protein
MPEYLAPGVYVEEVSYRSKSIEGVSTSTTGFVGPTRYGPVEQDLEVLTSLPDFERTYGDRQPLVFTEAGDPVTTPNHLWHAAHAYFENGGARLYVKRIYAPVDPEHDGRATGVLANPENLGLGSITVKARFPGAAGSRRVQLTLQLSADVMVQDDAGGRRLVGVHDRDVVVTIPEASTAPPDGSHSHEAAGSFSVEGQRQVWSARLIGGAWALLAPPEGGVPQGETKNLTEIGRASVHVLTVTVTDLPPDPDVVPTTWTGLPIDPLHERAGRPDSLFALFHDHPANAALASRLPVVIEADEGADGAEIAKLLVNARLPVQANPATGRQASRGMHDAVFDLESTVEERSVDVELSGGDDGQVPDPTTYEGGQTATDAKLGLVAFEDIEDISIVAAPGSSLGYETDDDSRRRVATIQQSLIGHCARMRYRIAVLDSGDGQTVGQVRQMKARIDSTYAALYYPWVTVVDPVTQNELQLPPSGFVCGIYARNDIQRAVYKAPANEVVSLAVGFEKMINKGQQDVLNPEGVNCFRYFPGRGMRLWGARTTSSDPEWKYVNLRRYFAYLEHSIDRGTQWAVFEPNGERLWANIRRTIEDFLFNEWQMGALLGDKPEKSYFVKCDRSTMTQNDLDNGRLVCQIGVAPLRPAEYVIFRIGQWTSDRRA